MSYRLMQPHFGLPKHAASAAGGSAGMAAAQRHGAGGGRGGRRVRVEPGPLARGRRAGRAHARRRLRLAQLLARTGVHVRRPLLASLFPSFYQPLTWLWQCEDIIMELSE